MNLLRFEAQLLAKQGDDLWLVSRADGSVASYSPATRQISASQPLQQWFKWGVWEEVVLPQVVTIEVQGKVLTEEMIINSVAEKAEGDPYMELPAKEDWRPYIVHHHWRGKGAHADWRIGLADFLIGWTWSDMVPGSVKEPVTTLAEAKEVEKDPSKWKIDWNTGQFRERQVRGGTVRKTSIYTTTKQKEPLEWMKVEGVVKPGEVGATRNFPGVFSIVDKGQVFLGMQKPWAHEYFLRGGKLAPGKYVIRALGAGGKDLEPGLTARDLWDLSFDDDKDIARCARKELQEHFAANGIDIPLSQRGQDLTDLMAVCRLHHRDWLEEIGLVDEAEKADVLPPAEETEGTGHMWLTIQAVDQTPYVLSGEAMSKKWLPPVGYSALPPDLRAKVPDSQKYWEKGLSEEERLSRRQELVDSNVLKQEKLRVIVGTPEQSQAANSPDQDGPLLDDVSDKNGQTVTGLLESQTHRAFTVLADSLYALGHLTREERIALSNAVGDMLDAFEESVREKLEEGVLSNEDLTRNEILEALAIEFKALAAKVGKFFLIRRWSRGPIQVRFGPTSEFFDLWVNGKVFVLDGDPASGESVLASPEKPFKYISAGEGLDESAIIKDPTSLDPGTTANPSKATAVFAELSDSGEVVILEEGEGRAKYTFKGKRLKGTKFLAQEDPGSEFWSLSTSGGPGISLKDKLVEGKELIAALAKIASGSKESVLAVWKDSLGSRRYVAVCSAEVQDLEGETILKEAMDFSINLSEKVGFRPILTIGHVPWAKVGESLWQHRLGMFWMEGGAFYKGNWLAEKVFEAIDGDREGRLRISIGFLYPVSGMRKGKYRKMFRYESTVTSSPALPLTAIGVVE